MEHQSQFDPSRQTVGKIYTDAITTTHEIIEVGDLTNTLMETLCFDINKTINDSRKTFNDKPFYIIVHEKKDLVMPTVIHRDLHAKNYRPYPEDDTVVFWVDPGSNTIRFCWCLPHFRDMRNMLENPDLYDKDMLATIKAWLMQDMAYFGFRHDENGNLEANPHFKDKPMNNQKGYTKILTDITFN